jgi:hypothetical protein
MIFHPDQYENMVPNGNSNRENDDNPHPSCGVHYFQTKPYICIGKSDNMGFKYILGNNDDVWFLKSWGKIMLNLE